MCNYIDIDIFSDSFVVTCFIFTLSLLGCRVLAPWIPAIINHLYWAILTCNGNGKELVERFISIIHHVCNRHTWTGNKHYQKCAHKQYTAAEVRVKLWLKPGSPPHTALKNIVMQGQLMRDMEKMTDKIYTTYLEVFHSIKIRYLPKSVVFNMEKMIAGTELAALDHNYSVNRDQVNSIKTLYCQYVVLFNWETRKQCYVACRHS